jgi:copper chaperone NosL
MKLPRTFRLILAATLTLAASSCSRGPMSGPPDLRLGRDECAECGMLVSEDRFSTASLVAKGGERLYYYFDDVGCLLDYERELPGDVTVIERYVHDHDTKAWVSAQDASFLLAGVAALQTPMGSGIAAFVTPNAARAAADQYGGDVLDLSRLREARSELMHARDGAADQPDTP